LVVNKPADKVTLEDITDENIPQIVEQLMSNTNIRNYVEAIVSAKILEWPWPNINEIRLDEAKKLIENILYALKALINRSKEELIRVVITTALASDLEKAQVSMLLDKITRLNNEVIWLNNEIERLQTWSRSTLPWILVGILGLLVVVMAWFLWARGRTQRA